MTSTTFKIVGLLFLIGYISAAKYPKVVGGKNTGIKQFPYLVSIRNAHGGSHFCGGSIISHRHILTAAHCVINKEKDDILVHTGVSHTDRPGNHFKIISIDIHPKFDITNEKGGFPHDIAVLTLANPIDYNKYQRKIMLPSRNVHNYDVAYLVGWGRMSRWDFNRSRQLQKLLVVLLPYEKCKPLVKHNINPEQICSYRSTTSGACNGDSGGPLVSHDEIVGIVSYGDTGICADDVPDIYTNVYAYRDFIESIINK